MINWKSAQYAPQGVRLFTRIQDGNGIRNEAWLTKQGNLWFTDGPNAMYVYYTPTHYAD